MSTTIANTTETAALSQLVLCHEKLASCSIPDIWKDALEDVRAFMDLSANFHDKESTREVPLEELQACHTRLLKSVEKLLEPPAIQDTEIGMLHEVVARAALVLATFRSRLVSDLDVLDTAHSETILFHKSDFTSPTANETESASPMGDFLRERLAIGAEELERTGASLEQKVKIAERKAKLVRAIRDEFGLRADSPGLNEGVAEFFSMLYNNTGIPADEIRVVMTSSMVFFALPFHEKGNELFTERFAALSPAERAPTAEFLTRLHSFTQKQFAHFPAFGFIDPSRLDHAKLSRVAARVEMDVDDVVKELASMVTILPLGEIDKYLVHDVWGHGWQAALLGFSSMYRGIASFGNPLDLSEEAERCNACKVSFRECFEGSGADLKLNDERFLTFVEAEISERLPIALTPVFAEMMADIIEYKFLEDNPEKASLMPSSSAFKELPTKLDLTFQDVPFYFAQATKVFRSWANKPDRQEKTVAQLVANGAEEGAAKAAAAKAVALWKAAEADRYSDELHISSGTLGEVSLNMIGRLYLNFASIHAATLRCYHEIGAVSPESSLLRSFRELMLIAASAFFEQSPSRNLWRIDEFLALRFPAIVHRLAQ